MDAVVGTEKDMQENLMDAIVQRVGGETTANVDALIKELLKGVDDTCFFCADYCLGGVWSERKPKEMAECFAYQERCPTPSVLYEEEEIGLSRKEYEKKWVPNGDSIKEPFWKCQSSLHVLLWRIRKLHKEKVRLTTQMAGEETGLEIHTGLTEVAGELLDLPVAAEVSAVAVEAWRFMRGAKTISRQEGESWIEWGFRMGSPTAIFLGRKLTEMSGSQIC